MASRKTMTSMIKLAAIPLLLGSILLGCASTSDTPTSTAAAAAGTYGFGRTPTAEELRRMDISIDHEGTQLPPGRGSAKEGAQVFVQKACVGCHGVTGLGGMAPQLRSKLADNLPVWKKERILPLRSPYATVIWDYINRGMPLGLEGTLTPNEVYSLTAYLLFLNKVIPEDMVLDEKNLPKVKMPIGDEFGKPHDWHRNEPRLKGYPY